MRVILLALLSLVTLIPAVLAGEWNHYQNARFGYDIAVPPSFTGKGEAANGDGQVFTSRNGRETLRVWGSNIAIDDFSAATLAAIETARAAGVKVTYEATTPTWASYSGIRSGTVVYVRMIALCSGTQYAAFALEYPKQDMAKFDMVVDKLVKSLDGPKEC